jgi:hypothetical protein
MYQVVVVIGLGEMGSIFARGILRLGHPVYPVTRDTDMAAYCKNIPQPELVLVAVGETDLQPILKQIPIEWQSRIVLLQNELLPRDWQPHHFENPTVISVWFEKKKGQDVKVLIPSPVFGPNAGLISNALATLDIPVRELATEKELELELVIKNVYILTTNIAGLVIGGTVDDLWSKNETLARDIANDVIDIQEKLTGNAYKREQLISGMVKAIDGDRAHKNMGRSAPARLKRAIQQADDFKLEVNKLREIAALQT